MYLGKLYKHSKWLFALVIFFIAGQLFINYKRGMVISPFYHYGMYSEVMKPKVAYGVFEITVNSNRLQGKDFTPPQWDKIILPLTYFASIDSSNQLYFSNVQRLMNKLRLQPGKEHFLSSCEYAVFEQWYSKYLEKMLDYKVDSINIGYREYEFNNQHLKPTAHLSQLTDLCR